MNSMDRFVWPSAGEIRSGTMDDELNATKRAKTRMPFEMRLNQDPGDLSVSAYQAPAATMHFVGGSC